MSWLPTPAASALRHQARDDAAREAIRLRTEQIRGAMLESLRATGLAGAEPLARRTRFAGNAERLWDLRPELMAVLASAHGEAAACRALDRINALFEDVLPPGLASRLAATRREPPSRFQAT